MDTHDSIEDARAALMLYQEFQLHEQEGDFDDFLLQVYDEGKKLVRRRHGKPFRPRHSFPKMATLQGWKIPEKAKDTGPSMGPQNYPQGFGEPGPLARFDSSSSNVGGSVGAPRPPPMTKYQSDMRLMYMNMQAPR